MSKKIYIHPRCQCDSDDCNSFGDCAGCAGCPDCILSCPCREWHNKEEVENE